MLEYSIVIPTYGEKGAKLIARMLPVLAYSCKLEHEIIIVDDGSEPQVVDELNNLCVMYNALLLHDDDNCGFAKACNAGMTMANGKSTILCNNDVIPIGDTFDQLYDTVNMYGVGIAGCKLLYPNDRIQHAGVCWINPARIPVKEGAAPVGGHGWFDHLGRFKHRRDIGSCRMEFRLCTGALMAINSELVKAVGLLDERFGMAAEDIDYNLRCLEVGMMTIYNGHVEAYHLEGATRGNTEESKAQHSEWTEKERMGLDFLFEKWSGVKWEMFEA